MLQNYTIAGGVVTGVAPDPFRAPVRNMCAFGTFIYASMDEAGIMSYNTSGGGIAQLAHQGGKIDRLTVDSSGVLYATRQDGIWSNNAGALAKLGNVGRNCNALIAGAAGTLYALTAHGASSINTATGAVTPVARVTDTPFANGTSYPICYLNNVIYATDDAQLNLWSLNTSTGAVASIGNCLGQEIRAIVTDGTNLFMTCGQGTELWKCTVASLPGPGAFSKLGFVWNFPVDSMAYLSGKIWAATGGAWPDDPRTQFQYT